MSVRPSQLQTASVRESVLLDFRPEAPKRRLTVVLLTEGTYPYVIGGVSTWCDQLLRNLDDIDWLVVPIVAGGLKRQPCYTLPENARLAGLVDLWGADRRSQYRPRAPRRPDLAAGLTRALLGWDTEPSQLVSELVWCHKHPSSILPSFRSKQSWKLFLVALEQVADESARGVTPGVHLDMATAVSCYQTLSWVAANCGDPTAAGRRHPCDRGWLGRCPSAREQAVDGYPNTAQRARRVRA